MVKGEKTLVILTPGFAKDEADSTCIPTQQNLILALNEKAPGLNIIVLAFDYPYIKRRYQWRGNTVISFNGRNRGGLAKILLGRKVLLTLKEICSSSEVIGLLSFWYGRCAVIGKKFADRNDVKHICWMWGQDARKRNKNVRRVGLKAVELAVLSDFLQKEFEKNYGIRPQYVIPPGIVPGQFSKIEVQRNIDILAVGSLIPLKRYDIFVNIIAQIKKQVPGIQAVLVGEGPERKALQALISACGLESNIVLAGELSHSEALATMQRAKVFLHPSSYEGFGIVCIEALYAGCHVISFCKPMNDDIEHWYIADSIDDMIAKCLGMLQSATTVFTPVKPFDINETAGRILSLFK